MKKRLLLAVLLLSLISWSYAQRGGQRMTVEERAKQITEWMTTELNLTNEQIAPVDSINLVFTKAQQVLFQSAEGDRSKIRESMAALEEEKVKSFSEILTKEQIELYKKKVNEMKDNRRGK